MAPDTSFSGSKWPSLVAGGTGAALCLIAGVVMTGWYTQSSTLVQLNSAWVPMQFNTAACMLLCGGAVLLLLWRGRARKLAVVPAAVVVIGAAATLAQYALGISLGVDTLFVEPFTITETTYPGRMAVNTAACFICSGLLLIAEATGVKQRASIALVGASVVLSLAVIGVIGYVFGTETIYGWARGTRMALHTAFGFVLISSGVLAHAYRHGGALTRGVPRWLPLPAGLLVLAVAASVAQAAEAAHEAQIKQSSDSVAGTLEEGIKTDLGAALRAFERMARRWRAAGGMPREEWERQATAYITDMPGLHAMHRTESSGVTQWHVSKGTDGGMVGAAEGLNFARMTASARETGASTLTPLVSDGNRPAEIVVGIPLFSGSRLDGFLLARYMAQPWLESCVPAATRKRFYLEAKLGAVEVYRQVQRTDEDTLFVTEQEFEFAGKPWKIAAWPNDEFLRQRSTMLPSFALVAGLLLAVLVSIATHLGLRAAHQAGELRVARDQLELKVAERTVELSQANIELERSNRELDDFAYVASHDLKAPLRDVDNLAKWIVEDVADSLPPNSMAHLDKLQARVRRMEKLLDDLLQYSRAGRKFDQSEVIDSAALISSMAELASPPPAFRIETPALGPRIEAPRAALEHVFLNLLSNAIKHHDRPDGRIWITAETNGKFAHFAVSDDGPGIPPEFHERVFRIFQTLKPRDKVEGSGIGLAIVKKLVEAHGGKVTLESQEGRGCIFSFTWPLQWAGPQA